MAKTTQPAAAPAPIQLSGYTAIKGDDEGALVNLLPDAIREAVLRIPDEAFDLTEGQVRKKAKPTPVDYALRCAFWAEFERIMRTDVPGAKLLTTHVYSGVCHDRYFYGKFLHNPDKVLWMVLPMRAYRRELEAMLAMTTRRLRELLNIPFKDKKGRIVKSNVDIFLRARKQVEDRVHGMALQRTETRGTQKHVHAHIPVTPAAPMSLTDAELADQIRQLEAEVGTQASGDRASGGIGDGGALPSAPEDDPGVIDVAVIRPALSAEEEELRAAATLSYEK